MHVEFCSLRAMLSLRECPRERLCIFLIVVNNEAEIDNDKDLFY